MISAYLLAGELARAQGRHEEALRQYETLFRPFIEKKQQAAKHFAAAFAPRTRWGLFFRNQVLRACSLPGVARWALGRDLLDRFTLPNYREFEVR